MSRTDRAGLREKVARALLKVEYYDCEPDAYDSLDAFFAEIDDEHLWRARDMADAAIAVCMEEARRAARNAYLNLSPEQRANGDILDDVVSAALRALRGEGERDA